MSRTFQFLLLLLLLAAGTVVSADADYCSNVVTDGPHCCGGVEVPYPFGIMDQDDKGDFRDGFGVTCDAGKLVLPTIGDGPPIPIGNFSVEWANASVLLPVGWQCYDSSGKPKESPYTVLEFPNENVYRISNTMNDLFVLGCQTLGYLRSKLTAYDDNTTHYTQFTGCLCYCDDPESPVSGACSGVGCCRADIPPNLDGNAVAFDDSYNHSYVVDFSPCDYAFVAQKGNYTFDVAHLKRNLSENPWLMPVTLDWAIRGDNLTCEEAMKNKTTYACISSNSICNDSINGPGYICNCTDGYEGNPYKLDGCTDIDECDPKNNYPCMGDCENKQGSYNCACPKHSHSTDPFKIPCNQSFPLKAKITTGVLVVLLIVAIIVFVSLLLREKKKTLEYFKKNGGPKLKDLSTIKLYKKDDIRKIQKSCNIIGEGGFGKVYKGCIGNDTQLVAVKEPIKVKSKHNDQFANEISIQSRVIHKNIVKLLGCCLEVHFPILVYEFVPKGSLHDILHGDKSTSLSIGQRLMIAAGSAEGLAYMHSKANATILHGDVKPANILINDDYIPKISDFGISRLIAKDKEHTELVIGDRSYMDPVFFQTGILTDKSDVYSFGVVLLELITRKKASHTNQNELLREFNEAYKKEKSVIELVDKELIEVDPQLLHSLTEMIHECLSLDVDQRPDMTDLEKRLSDMVKRFPITE